MRQTIQEGGDTDTNACIVGGMIGALIGFKQIPEYIIQKLITFDCTKNNDIGHKRPEFLSVRKYGITGI